ncbi:MAG TPA: hypothetical protein VK658_25170 [Chryseolinea sp.]|nr:hypothetical protein [Chryseolinea sp.]
MKPFSLVTLFAAGGMTALLISCSPAFYSTVGQNVPLFHEKGEFALSGGIMSASNTSEGFSPFANLSSGIALQAAVAIDSGAALLTSYYDMAYDGEWQVNARYAELSGGLFKYNAKSKLVGELFAGVGYGTMKNQSGPEAINAEFIKYFLQPSCGFRGKVFELAFTPRMGVVDYLSHSPSDRSEVQEFFAEKKTTFVFEPGFTVRVGYKNFKAQYQMNYSSFHFSQAYRSEEYDPVMDCYGSLSLMLRITRRWKH